MKHYVLLLVILALTALAGCGSSRVPIGGAVTFDGKPVSEGSISFEPADGQGPSTGGKIADGRYELIGEAAPMPGKKTVRIIAVRKTGRKVLRGSFTSTTPEMVDEIERYIPDIYNTRSTLACDVSRDGSKQIDFNLKPKW
jgi:hypothetical protein